MDGHVGFSGSLLSLAGSVAGLGKCVPACLPACIHRDLSKLVQRLGKSHSHFLSWRLGFRGLVVERMGIGKGERDGEGKGREEEGRVGRWSWSGGRWRLRIGGEGGKGERGKEEGKRRERELYCQLGLWWRRWVGRFGVCDLGSLRIGEREGEREIGGYLGLCGFIPVMMETMHGLSFAFPAARRVRLYVAMYVCMDSIVHGEHEITLE